MTRYDDHVRAQRRPLAVGCDLLAAEQLREFVRMGTLAASSHNTQPWRFRIRPRCIEIEPDLHRRCPVVDPDDGHLWKSLGCAAENVVLSAEGTGLRTSVEVIAEASAAKIRIELEPGDSKRKGLSDEALAAAIPQRQCTKMPYDCRAIDSADLRAMEQAGSGEGVRTMLVTELSLRESITELVRAGNIRQMGDVRFRSELMEWIRFHDREAVERSDGLSGRTTAQPAVPRWLGRVLLRFLMTPKSQSETDVRLMRSSPAVAVVLSDRDEARAWIEVGRACQRLMLTATRRGLRTAFINQPIEVVDLRPQLAAILGVAPAHPLLMLRVGYGPIAAYSLRRPLDSVIVSG